MALRTTEYDDGWTMVDRDSEGNSDDSSHDSASEDNDSDSGMDVVRLGRASSVDSLVHVHAMEESWFVTPPPCFSSQTGTKSIQNHYLSWKQCFEFGTPYLSQMNLCENFVSEKMFK